MRRRLELFVAAALLALGVAVGPAGADSTCYRLIVPNPDGGEPTSVLVCPPDPPSDN